MYIRVTQIEHAVLDFIRDTEAWESIQQDFPPIEYTTCGTSHYEYTIPDNDALIKELGDELEYYSDCGITSAATTSRLKKKLLNTPSKPKVVSQDIQYHEAVIFQMVADCTKLLMQAKYELGIPRDAVSKALKEVRVYNNRRHYCGRASQSLIQFNLQGVTKAMRACPYFEEYKAYSSDPVIGGITTLTCWDWLLVLVSHEVAHHIQYAYCVQGGRGKKGTQFGKAAEINKPHGRIFKTIYRYLRRDLVNKKIGTLGERYRPWGLEVIKS